MPWTSETPTLHILYVTAVEIQAVTVYYHQRTPINRIN